MRVAVVELDARLYTMTSHLLMPKMGSIEVGTYLAAHGHDVSVYVECMNGVDEKHVRGADVIGFSVGVGNANRAYEMAARLKGSTSATLIAGGPHATVVPGEALDHGFDYVVRGEGEETALDLLHTLERGGDVGDVLGISYIRNGAPVDNAPRPFMKTFDMTPSYSLLRGFRRKGVVEQLRTGQVYENFVQTTRGCPFPCDFCYENRIGGTGYRRRSIPSVVRDIQYKIDFLRTNMFYITDANFGLDAAYTKELLRAILDAGIKGRFTALVRIEIAHDEELLGLLKAAGFEMLCVGIESLDDETLDSVSKRQRAGEIEECIAALRRHGLNVFGLFIGGFERDTEQTFVRIVDFALKHDMVGINIMVLGDYPGMPDSIVPEHRYFNRNWDYFPGHYLTFFMPRMRPSRFQRVVSREALRFYSWPNCLKTLFRSGWHGFELKFGGRYVYQRIWEQAQSYLPHLEGVERGCYEGDEFTADERLRAECARSRGGLPPKRRVVSTVSPTVSFSTPVAGF